MNIAVVTPFVSQLAGGLFSSVRNLALQMVKSHDVHVFALHDIRVDADFQQWLPIVPRLFNIWPSMFGYGMSMPLFRALMDTKIDIIHVHGIRMWPSTVARLVACRKRVPYVISPRGQLDPWIMAQHPWKKRIMHRLFEDKNLRMASFIHVTSDLEKTHVQKRGFNNPVITVPNGVDHSEFDNADSDFALQQWPSLRGRHVLLYLSNIHPKKGLELLAQAWSMLSNKYPNWVLVVAGSGEENYVEDIKQLFSGSVSNGRTLFVGDVRGDAKRSLYALCDVFVLPTYSENFGNVVAEAMAASKPVVTTKGTPWKCLEELGAGWWTEADQSGIEGALNSALALDNSTRKTMGLRGRCHIEENLSWKRVADQMLACYEGLIGAASEAL